MEEELKKQLKVCYASLAVLEKPTHITAYNRNETNTMKKKEKLIRQIDEIKLQIKELQ